MLILLDGGGLEPVLPKPSNRRVLSMVTARVIGEQPMHPPGDLIIGRWPQHEMHVVRHEASCQDANRTSLLRRSHEACECRVIRVVVKDALLVIRAIHHVIAIACDDSSGPAWHLGKLPAAREVVALEN